MIGGVVQGMCRNGDLLQSGLVDEAGLVAGNFEYAVSAAPRTRAGDSAF